ncbi:prepilin-type N-terminal cleavage/methylation domain-containing protein [Planctobacterium marinum]|uniref:prepilin-type N-terminal cleavage/methylation domain-containing protein n=1 Tax=Planctobacterium marinum TaxID=1631968 RepID=UPI002B4BD6AA|nr:prepilin-type N-terminal cleavage/methylation domain-containing protein [Planctobacterium marinum]
MRVVNMKTANFKQQKGFTLIELIIVIIILGILAVTAAPKFLDIQDDAQQSAISGINGALRSASQIAHSANLVNSGATISLEGATYDVVDTYLVADEICRIIGLTDSVLAAGVTTSSDGQYICEYEADAGSDDEGRTTIYPSNYNGPNATTPGNCFVQYTDADNATTTPSDSVTTPVITQTLTCDDVGAA